MAKIFRRIIRIISILAAVGLAGLLIPRLVTSLHAMNRIYSHNDAPARPVAIVFGAGLWRDGSPTPILRDRVATAAELYFAGKVDKLLMSGDNTTIYYNEPGAMQDYALQLGVPAEDIVLDYAGRRTYDTCYRAKAIFGVTNAILVTQDFHLPRALYICSALGLDAVGVSADRQTYRRSSLMIWNFRELFATFTALADVHILRPLPVLGKYEPIFD
ncbi:MAG: YdcF family protein [Anaerolineales bacterium]|jgi:vancomycin permeability regulator SanA|nr:YdcF family protein [Anaerolineales bacterium]